MNNASHISVMKDEVLEFFATRYPGKFLDMTFGGGGHARAILEGHWKNSVVAVDCDPEAMKRAETLKKDFPERFQFVDGFFDEVFVPGAEGSKDFLLSAPFDALVKSGEKICPGLAYSGSSTSMPSNKGSKVSVGSQGIRQAQGIGGENDSNSQRSDVGLGRSPMINLPSPREGLGVGGFDGILFDLGVSSFQLDTPERGFSFRNDAPADMRMNPRTGLPAWQLIDESDRETLEKIVRDLGEEPRWRPVVKALEEAKGSEKIRTTLGLAEVIAAQAKYGGKLHPATRVFMGLRMAVNDEIGRLERALPKAFEALADGGILAVISFHSIEDRVVKIFFQSVTRPKDSAPAKLLLKKVGRPEKDETAMNARSRSAKLRVLQKNTSQ